MSRLFIACNLFKGSKAFTAFYIPDKDEERKKKISVKICLVVWIIIKFTFSLWIWTD